jgi:hypothetical protein
MIEFENKFEEEIEVSKIIIDYTQPGDCAEDREKYQTLRLESEYNGVAPFIRMSLVDCDHFSISGIEDLQKIIKDFEEKMNYPGEENNCDK